MKTRAKSLIYFNKVTLFEAKFLTIIIAEASSSDVCLCPFTYTETRSQPYDYFKIWSRNSKIETVMTYLQFWSSCVELLTESAFYRQLAPTWIWFTAPNPRLYLRRLPLFLLHRDFDFAPRQAVTYRVCHRQRNNLHVWNDLPFWKYYWMFAELWWTFDKCKRVMHYAKNIQHKPINRIAVQRF
jgi:hypothetical protein